MTKELTYEEFVKNHKCGIYPNCSCCCVALEPNPNCNIHGYPMPNKCTICGRFFKIEENKDENNN